MRICRHGYTWAPLRYDGQVATDPINPVDPLEEEAERVFADPAIRARIEEFHRQRAAGRLRTFSTREAIERLGLDPDLLLDPDPTNNG
jgi:hypothetical protein